jgi:hypothetical protein
MKTTWFQIRVDPAEKQAFDEAAKIAGLTASAWARMVLRRAAIHEFEDAGRRFDLSQFDKVTNGGGDQV